MMPWWSKLEAAYRRPHYGELPHWWDQSPNARVRAIPLHCLEVAAQTYGFDLNGPVGFGHQGFVWLSPPDRVVKVTGTLEEVETALRFFEDPELSKISLVPRIFAVGKLPCAPSCGLIQREDLPSLEATLYGELLRGGASEGQAKAALRGLESSIRQLMDREVRPEGVPIRLSAEGRQNRAETLEMEQIFRRAGRGADPSKLDFSSEKVAGERARKDLSVLTDLSSFYSGFRIAPYPVLVRTFGQIARGLHRLYDRGFYMEDLVLDNFGARSDGSPVVRDFGYSTTVPPGLGTLGRIGR